MKLNRLLLCSLFVLTGCNNNGIKTYKELPEIKNDTIKVDEPDGVKDVVGKNAYLSYQFNKVNPVDEPLPAIRDDSYGDIPFETSTYNQIGSLRTVVSDDLENFAENFAYEILGLNAYTTTIEEFQKKALELYFKKLFCNASYQIREGEIHIYGVKVNKLDCHTKSLKENTYDEEINSFYTADFQQAYANILREEQNESVIKDFLRKYGVGILNLAVYASYDIEIMSYRVRSGKINDYFEEFRTKKDVEEASVDDYYHFTTLNETTNKYEEKLLTYTIMPFNHSRLFPEMDWRKSDAVNRFNEVFEQFVAGESERILKGENNFQTKQPKTVKDLHYQLDTITTEAKFSSKNPYTYEYNLNDLYKSYDLDKMKELGYKKMYFRPGIYMDQITNRTRVTFEVTIGGQKITIFNKKQLVKKEGNNNLEMSWYELDFEKVLASDRQVSCKIVPYGSTARIPLVQFQYAYTF